MKYNHHKNPIILIIDDEMAILKTLKDALEEESFWVETSTEPHKAIDLIGHLVPDLILLDIFMPQVSGLTLLTNIKREYPEQKVMVISGFGTIPIALESIKLGALDFIEKPLNLDVILSKLQFLQEPPTKTNRLLAHEDKQLVGESYLFKELMHAVNTIASLPTPLVIYGEYGVGKTTITEYIHKLNHKALDTLLVIDGSHESSITTLEQAFSSHYKTIFIKNIEQFSELDQKKLLAFIQLHKNTNVRFIASSTQNLFMLMRQGTFNSSLFNFFNVTPLEIPSLNKRRHDIPLLSSFFLSASCAAHHKNYSISPDAHRFLRNYHWLENIAQLKKIIETLVAQATASTGIITLQDLQPFLAETSGSYLEEQRFLRFSSLNDAISSFEKEYLIHMLQKNRFDLEQTSTCLNLNISQLRDRMSELQISYKG